MDMANLENEMIRGLDNAADGAFIVDRSLRIQFWNEAAEEILGFSKKEAEGQFCYQLLQGIDEGGELICKEHCQILKLALRSDPVSNYDLQVSTSEGEPYWLNMSILSLGLGASGNGKMIVHMFRDVSQKKRDEFLFSRLLETARTYQKLSGKNHNNEALSPVEELTPRQHEVLALLAHGFGTEGIADNLTISQNTVRNHIQQILEKFRVHSRVEAIAFALKNGLLRR
jgi:PAS domain S-box-containing protein